MAPIALAGPPGRTSLQDWTSTFDVGTRTTAAVISSHSKAGGANDRCTFRTRPSGNGESLFLRTAGSERGELDLPTLRRLSTSGIRGREADIHKVLRGGPLSRCVALGSCPLDGNAKRLPTFWQRRRGAKIGGVQSHQSEACERGSPWSKLHEVLSKVKPFG